MPGTSGLSGGGILRPKFGSAALERYFIRVAPSSSFAAAACANCSASWGVCGFPDTVAPFLSIQLAGIPANSVLRLRGFLLHCRTPHHLPGLERVEGVVFTWKGHLWASGPHLL